MLYGLAAEAGGGVVVDDAGGLQEGVDDDRADELEAALFELLRDGLRQRRGYGEREAGALVGVVAGEVPEEVGEGLAGALHLHVDFCAGDGGFDLGAGADDAFVLHEAIDIGLREAGYLGGVEVFEGLAEGFALAEDDGPGKAGLEAFEHEELPEGAAVAEGNAPLFVVVLLHERVLWVGGIVGVAGGPGAAELLFGGLHGIYCA